MIGVIKLFAVRILSTMTFWMRNSSHRQIIVMALSLPLLFVCGCSRVENFTIENQLTQDIVVHINELKTEFRVPAKTKVAPSTSIYIGTGVWVRVENKKGQILMKKFIRVPGDSQFRSRPNIVIELSTDLEQTVLNHQ